jgi:hypothetical protein
MVTEEGWDRLAVEAADAAGDWAAVEDLAEVWGEE